MKQSTNDIKGNIEPRMIFTTKTTERPRNQKLTTRLKHLHKTLPWENHDRLEDIIRVFNLEVGGGVQN